MEKQKKNQIKKILSWMLILSLVALLTALPMIAAQEDSQSGPQASILSATAENRDITAVVLGGGTITAADATAITIPSAVKIKEYLVSNGDVVTEGQVVATADRVSVMTAITEVQETMEALRKKLNDVRNETENTKITAIAGGTVKTVYAAADENVQDVMLRDGALAVISLDGLMAVQVRRDTKLTGGDTVCVILSGGREVEGRVESNLEGILTVTVEDEGFAAGEEVRVTTEDGDRIGSGTLYIHSPWNVVAYAGTVSRVRISEGAKVSAGQQLFELKNTGHAAQFDRLSAQHREYEKLMLELFKMYQSEQIVAPHDGIITGVDKTGSYMLADSGAGWTLSLLANGPGGDENSYTNYIGQVAEVGIDGLIMKMNPQAFSVTDYHDLSGVPLNTELMTENTTYNGDAPIYVLTTVTDSENGNQTRKEWVQLSASAITAGDILLFAGGNSGVVWIVKVGHADLPQNPQPTEPADPTDPTTPSGPSGDKPQGGGRPSMGGGMPGMGGGMTQEETLYGLETVTIASVTAQETVSVSITVDELDILKLSVGQQASINVEALPGQQFEGTVTEISASGENEGGNSKFTVTVTLEKIPEMLPGMSASVSIALTAKEQVVSLPVAALIEQGTKTLVYRSYDEETGEFADPVTVTTGISDGEYVQILSGIGLGDTVYYPYYDTLVISDAPQGGGGFPFG